MNAKSILLYLTLFLILQDASAQNYDAEIVKYSSFCEAGTNKLTQVDSVTIQINNRVGDKYTEISIPYSKNDRVSDLDAWIENMDGTKVRDLKRSEVVDKSAFSHTYLFADHFQKCFQLKYNIYPYKVVYTYKTTTSDYLTIAWWTPVIYREIPTNNASLRVVIPKSFRFNQFINNISDAKIDSTKSDLVLEWKASYDKPYKPEIFSQLARKYTMVVISPISFKYGIEGSMKNWESYGNWQYRLIKGLDILPEEEKNAISSLIKGINDKREIVKVLYHYLQDHTRYINVSIKIGGLKPYPASYVAQNKYGDCKALSNYMKTLLSYAGIESFYANVNASEQPRDLIKNFYGPQFNHAVLAVPLNNDTIWLENTSNISPFGYMGTFTQNREALLISENNSRLVRIPAMNKEENHVSNKLEFELTINGPAKIMLNNSFKGEEFERYNEIKAEINDTEIDSYIRKHMPFDNCEVVNWELKKLNRDTARIELLATLNLYKFLKPLGNEYYFSLHPTEIPLFTVPANRKLPVVLPYPVFVSDTLIYKFPAGYEMKTQADSFSIKSNFGIYDMKIDIIDGRIRAVKNFELFQGEYKTEQYPEFYAFIKSIKDKDNKKIIIKPISNTPFK